MAFVFVCVSVCGCSLRVCAVLVCVSSSAKTRSVFRCAKTGRDCLLLPLCKIGNMSPVVPAVRGEKMIFHFKF